MIIVVQLIIIGGFLLRLLQNKVKWNTSIISLVRMGHRAGGIALVLLSDVTIYYGLYDYAKNKT